jgi:hypothetical protein
MDPVTAALNLLTALVSLGTKVWEATPAPLQAQGAADWATFGHNAMTALLELQSKLVVKP